MAFGFWVRSGIRQSVSAIRTSGLGPGSDRRVPLTAPLRQSLRVPIQASSYPRQGFKKGL